MYAPVKEINSYDLPCDIIAATCCAECPNPPCTRACPTGIDVQNVLKQLLANHPMASRMVTIRGAKDFGESAID